MKYFLLLLKFEISFRDLYKVLDIQVLSKFEYRSRRYPHVWDNLNYRASNLSQ